MAAVTTQRDLIQGIQKTILSEKLFTWFDIGNGKKILIRSKEYKDDVFCVDERIKALLRSETLPQYVWPAASNMCQWIHDNREIFVGKNVLEIGSGTGIVGFTAAQYADNVVLTDCSPVSLALLDTTKTVGGFDNCLVSELKWGEEGAVEQIIDAYPHLKRFDIVIGSEVFYFNFSLRLGLKTAQEALQEHGMFYCGSVARSERMEADLQTIPEEMGFVLNFMEENGPFQLYAWSY